MLVTRHAELVSASHSEPVLVFHRGQMLKRVQHDEMIINMRRGRDVCVQRPRFFTHANRANPAKGLEQIREIRGIRVRL